MLAERVPTTVSVSMLQKSPPKSEAIRVFSFPKWCEFAGLTPRTGRRLLASGKGPKVTQLSERRIGIRADHHNEWLESCVRG